MIDVKITLPNENQAADFSNFVDINDNKFSNIKEKTTNHLFQ